MEKISLGSIHTCMINKEGELFCWGSNNKGQIGDNTLVDKNTPTQIGTDKNWATVSAGREHTCGVKTTGELFCWGSNNKGQIGDNTFVDKKTPTKICTNVIYDNSSNAKNCENGTGTDWLTVSAGNYHTCGVRTTGDIYCWGNISYTFSDKKYSSISFPINFASISSNVITGNEDICSVSGAGTILECLGKNENDGYSNIDSSVSKITLPNNNEKWSIVSTGNGNYCGVTNSNNLYCWGPNGYGSLGDGTSDNKNKPTQIGTDKNWLTVSVGSAYHVCGVTTTGELFCWGYNFSGQVGNGSVCNDLKSYDGSSFSFPTRVGQDKDWLTVSAGGSHTCGMKTTGELFCWGNNKNGQLGVSNGDCFTAPQLVNFSK